MSSPTFTLKSISLACTLVATGLMLRAESATGAECGCASHKQTCQHAGHDGCTCKCGGWLKHNCLTKAWGSMGKLFSFAGGGCDDSNCDDACDAAMVHELMMTEPAYPSHHHVNPMRVPPPAMMDSHPAEPRILTPPRIMQQRPASPLPQPVERAPQNRIDPPVPAPEPESETDGGSLFDTLSDPFQDDDDAKMERFRSVRPSSYRSASLKAIRPQSSRRRVSRSSR